MWEKGLAAWEEYRNAIRLWRDATRRAKAHVELNLARGVKDKKGFITHVSNKRKPRENTGPLLNEASAVVTESAEKVE